MAGEYIEFDNNNQPAINDTNLNRLQQLIKQDIQGAVSGDTLPIGTIVPFGSNTVPENWLLCDGSAISRTQYQDLFNTIGITFGQGDGFETFNLPDLRDRVPVGKDSNDTDFNLLGNTGGEKTHTLTVEEIPSHTHQIAKENWTISASTGTITIHNYAGTERTASGSTGGGQAHNILQPYIVTNYIIKAFQSAGTVATVVDNLNSTSTTDALSANQGNVLKNLLDGTTLYDNSTGSSTDITLSENSEGYKRFIIEAINVEEQAICLVPEIIEPNGKKFPIITINTGGGGTKTFLGNSTWQVSGNQIIKTQANWLTTLNKNGATELTSYNNVRITKVIGYKY